MINKPQHYLIFLCILLCILVFFPILQTGFTTTDDAMFTISGYKNAKYAAVNQGRIGYIVLGYFAYLPYLIDNAIYFQLVRLGFVLLTLTLFSFCVYYLLNSFSIALLSGIFWLAFLQITWDHNLITSYPVSLQIPLQLLFLSLIFFKKYVLTKHVRDSILAAIFYFCAMFNEAFVLYFPIFLIIQWQHSGKTDGIILRVRKLLYGALSIIIAFCLYLLLYAAWRWLHPSSYPGNILYLGNVAKAILTIFQLSISSLPGYYYFSRFNAYIFYAFHDPFSVAGFMDQMRVEWLIKACVVFWSTIIILYRSADENPCKRTLLYAFSLCIAAIFLPNILLGITSKYQYWVFSWGIKGYVTTYYSYLATICALAVIVTYILQLVKQSHIARVTLVLFFAVMATYFSFITDYYNFFVAQDQKLSHAKWKIVERFLKTSEFEMIPDGSIIYAPTLYDHRGNVEIHSGYWDAYINRKTGKSVNVIRRLSENTIEKRNNIYFLKLLQEPHAENQVLVFGRMEKINAVENEIAIGYSPTVFSYSINRILGLIGFTAHGNSNNNAEVIFVNNLLVKEKSGRTFAAQIDLRGFKTDFPAIKIKSDSLICLNDFIITYYKEIPNLSPVVLEFKTGWSTDELTHRWSISKNAEIDFYNNYFIPKSAFIEFSLGSITPRTVKIFFNSILVHQAVLSTGKSYPIKLKDLMINPGKNVLKFETDVPPAPSGTGDPRALSFCIGGIRYGFH